MQNETGQTDTLSIDLPRGGTLEVQVTPAFMDLVANHFDLPRDTVTKDHVRMFVWGALHSAVSKAERKGDG